MRWRVSHDNLLSIIYNNLIAYSRRVCCNICDMRERDTIYCGRDTSVYIWYEGGTVYCNRDPNTLGRHARTSRPHTDVTLDWVTPCPQLFREAPYSGSRTSPLLDEGHVSGVTLRHILYLLFVTSWPPLRTPICVADCLCILAHSSLLVRFKLDFTFN